MFSIITLYTIFGTCFFILSFVESSVSANGIVKEIELNCL